MNTRDSAHVADLATGEERFFTPSRKIGVHARRTKRGRRDPGSASEIDSL